MAIDTQKCRQHTGAIAFDRKRKRETGKEKEGRNGTDLERLPDNLPNVINNK